MRIYTSSAHRAHNPPFEVFEGGRRVPYFETPDRIDRILDSLGGTTWADLRPADDFGLEPILAVHDEAYLNFLATAWDEWRAQSIDLDPTIDGAGLLPATFPPAGWRRRPDSLLGRAGYYMMDMSAPIVAGTYAAALASVNSALSAARAVMREQKVAFALCRPPGHHAGRENCGGYCYLNNAAIAAQSLTGLGKVALLDVDYHAGNGTQDIFYARSDVLTISIHADPAFEYPYFSGYADERGSGQGAGFHRNFPMAAGTNDSEYLSVLNEAAALIEEFEPQYLVVSTGMDIYESDPLGRIKVSTSGIRSIAERIAGLGLPTVIVMEGGYNNDLLGVNVVNFLEPFERGANAVPQG